jgi:hypothetical protein
MDRMFSLLFQVSWELKLHILGDLDNDLVVAFSCHREVTADQPVGDDGSAHSEYRKQDMMNGKAAFVEA